MSSFVKSGLFVEYLTSQVTERVMNRDDADVEWNANYDSKSMLRGYAFISVCLFVSLSARQGTGGFS